MVRVPTIPTVSITTSGGLRKSALRHANDRLMLDFIRRSPGISRAEIARATGISRTSVAFVINRLIKHRYVREERAEGVTQAGRPPTALQLCADSMMAVAVEIARPVSNVVLTDLNGGIVERRSVAWHGDTGTFLDSILMAIDEVTRTRKTSRILGVGVSVPGTLDKVAGKVIGAESLGWFNVDLQQMLGRRLEWPLFMENDANLSAIAEQWFAPGSGEALRYFVYVRTQGGLGTGVVVDGRILHGVTSAGTEFGHVMLYPDGVECSCGNRGCWEQYASSAAMVRTYRELGGAVEEGDDLQKSLLIVKRCREGDEAARTALHKTASYLSLGFVNLVAALNPQSIIMGEPFASAWDLIEDTVWSEMRKRTPEYVMSTLQLLPSRIGAEPALRGAAALVLARFFNRIDVSVEVQR